MEPLTRFTLDALAVGAGATVVMDAWMAVRKRLLGIAPPDYRMVGRWFAHMPRGRFRHARIADAAPVAGEGALGWAVHYATGAAFAAVLLAACGAGWARSPTLAPALLVGLASVAAPFLVMQPAMGAGIAASRTPRPAAARLQSITTHLIFGFGLYAAAAVLASLT
jgi:hypothetical protein